MKSDQIEKPARQFPVRIIVLTTAIAGTLDICAAFINTYLRSGASPQIVLQYIASGVLAGAAFSGGLLTAAFGLAAHYVIVAIWTLLFFFIYPKINLPATYKIPVGFGYGAIIWLIMNVVVLPLSNVRHIPFTISNVTLGIGFIMFLVGLPISLMYHNALSRQNL